MIEPMQRAMAAGSSSRRAVVWLVTLVLVAIGSQVGHVLAYRLVYPESEVRWRELLATGHSYLPYEPLLLAAAAACAAVSLLVVAADEVRGRRPQALPAWAFALLPPLAFAAQELLERLLAGAGVHPAFLAQPTFRIGLLLQLPCGLAAYAVARLLLRAASRLGAWLAGAAGGAHPADGRRAPRPRAIALPRPSPLASGRCGRGPPLVPV
jgi:hypothetical protein